MIQSDGRNSWSCCHGAMALICRPSPPQHRRKQKRNHNEHVSCAVFSPARKFQTGSGAPKWTDHWGHRCPFGNPDTEVRHHPEQLWTWAERAEAARRTKEASYIPGHSQAKAAGGHPPAAGHTTTIILAQVEERRKTEQGRSARLARRRRGGAAPRPSIAAPRAGALTRTAAPPAHWRRGAAPPAASRSS